jgi:hypothetical protein
MGREIERLNLGIIFLLNLSAFLSLFPFVLTSDLEMWELRSEMVKKGGYIGSLEPGRV